jgi:hypothetical protein
MNGSVKGGGESRDDSEVPRRGDASTSGGLSRPFQMLAKENSPN